MQCNSKSPSVYRGKDNLANQSSKHQPMNIVSQQNACQLLETGIASSQNEQALKDVETANNLPAQ